VPLSPRDTITSITRAPLTWEHITGVSQSGVIASADGGTTAGSLMGA